MQFSTYWRGFSCAATSPTPATKRIIATLDAVFMTNYDITASSTIQRSRDLACAEEG